MSKPRPDNNKPPFDNAETIVQINFQLGYAVALVVVSYWIWPTDPHWYAFAVMSIFCRLAAGGLVFKSLRQMWSLHKRRKQWREFQKRGKAPKNARLVADSDLHRKGMK